MKCSDNCGYFYQAEGEKYPCCHFDGPDGWAPCEQEEENYDESNDPEVCENDAE